MKKFIFEFTVDPTDNSWWSSYRNETIKVSAESLKEAKALFREILRKNFYFQISENGMKTAMKMYTDTNEGAKQIGLVFKASTEIESSGKWVKKYANIWAEIHTLESVF